MASTAPPDISKRLTNAAKRDDNRELASPSSLPRPEGKSCDEYPFAST
ncbi:NucA/NucB deoxyribonuclease domain-containing protein [Streptomyces sp. HUCO-GS316]